MRRTYLDKFGVEMNLPAYYIYQSKIVPHVEDHVLELACHILPKQFDQSVKTIMLNGEVKEGQDFQDFENFSGKDLIFKL